MGNLASVDWNWAGFQGPTGESLEERIDGLLAIGVRSLVLRDFGLDEYLAHQEKAGARMPLAATVHQWQSIARAQGKGRLDHTAILTVFEEIAGVQVRSQALEAKVF